MKQSIFLTAAIFATAAVAFIIFFFVLGNPANFANGEVRTVPNNLLGTVYTGGIVVPLSDHPDAAGFHARLRAHLFAQEGSGPRVCPEVPEGDAGPPDGRPY